MNIEEFFLKATRLNINAELCSLIGQNNNICLHVHMLKDHDNFACIIIGAMSLMLEARLPVVFSLSRMVFATNWIWIKKGVMYSNLCDD